MKRTFKKLFPYIASAILGSSAINCNPIDKSESSENIEALEKAKVEKEVTDKIKEEVATSILLLLTDIDNLNPDAEYILTKSDTLDTYFGIMLCVADIIANTRVDLTVVSNKFSLTENEIKQILNPLDTLEEFTSLFESNSENLELLHTVLKDVDTAPYQSIEFGDDYSTFISKLITIKNSFIHLQKNIKDKDSIYKESISRMLTDYIEDIDSVLAGDIYGRIKYREVVNLENFNEKDSRSQFLKYGLNKYQASKFTGGMNTSDDFLEGYVINKMLEEEYQHFFKFGVNVEIVKQFLKLFSDKEKIQYRKRILSKGSGYMLAYISELSPNDIDFIYKFILSGISFYDSDKEVCTAIFEMWKESRENLTVEDVINIYKIHNADGIDLVEIWDIIYTHHIENIEKELLTNFSSLGSKSDIQKLKSTIALNSQINEKQFFISLLASIKHMDKATAEKYKYKILTQYIDVCSSKNNINSWFYLVNYCIKNSISPKLLEKYLNIGIDLNKLKAITLAKIPYEFLKILTDYGVDYSQTGEEEFKSILELYSLKHDSEKISKFIKFYITNKANISEQLISSESFNEFNKLENNQIEKAAKFIESNKISNFSSLFYLLSQNHEVNLELLKLEFSLLQRLNNYGLYKYAVLNSYLNEIQIKNMLLVYESSTDINEFEKYFTFINENQLKMIDLLEKRGYSLPTDKYFMSGISYAYTEKDADFIKLSNLRSPSFVVFMLRNGHTIEQLESLKNEKLMELAVGLDEEILKEYSRVLDIPLDFENANLIGQLTLFNISADEAKRYKNQSSKEWVDYNYLMMEKIQKGEISKEMQNLLTSHNISFPKRYPYETLKLMLEKEINPKKANAIVIFPQSDWNSAFDQDGKIKILSTLHIAYNVSIYEAASKEDFANILDINKDIDLIVIGAHGSETSMHFGKDGTVSLEDIASFHEFRGHFNNGANAILISCSTGKSSQNIAKEISNTFDIPVIAPTEDTTFEAFILDSESNKLRGGRFKKESHEIIIQPDH